MQRIFFLRTASQQGVLIRAVSKGIRHLLHRSQARVTRSRSRSLFRRLVGCDRGGVGPVTMISCMASDSGSMADIFDLFPFRVDQRIWMGGRDCCTRYVFLMKLGNAWKCMEMSHEGGEVILQGLVFRGSCKLDLYPAPLSRSRKSQLGTVTSLGHLQTALAMKCRKSLHPP